MKDIQRHASEPLALTMWDYSYMVRRQGKEAEFADWDRALDELSDRGYNCVRIDPFPHLVAAGSDGKSAERFTMLPEPRNFTWGNHTTVEIEPRAGLLEFLTKARDRGIRVGLSTWLRDDASHRRDAVADPADFTRIWMETLEFLELNGLLDMVAWVDLCNEFPMGWWAHAAYPRIFGTSWRINLLPLVRRWSGETKRRVETYYGAIAPLKKRYPRLRYTFSCQPVGSGNLRSLDTSHLDIVETHIWLAADSPFFTIASGEALWVAAYLPGLLRLHARLASWLYRRGRERWLDFLSDRMDLWASWAKERGLALFTTEGWASSFYGDVNPAGDGAEWEWVKDICAEGVRMALEKGWEGICTSNYSSPIHRGMWRDVRWHRRLTSMIRSRQVEVRER